LTQTQSNQLALETYADKKIDFVDCLLYGFKAIFGYDVFTFDKKLKAIIENEA
jgi:predicted nucleic-acid-binding protein